MGKTTRIIPRDLAFDLIHDSKSPAPLVQKNVPVRLPGNHTRREQDLASQRDRQEKNFVDNGPESIVSAILQNSGGAGCHAVSRARGVQATHPRALYGLDQEAAIRESIQEEFGLGQQGHQGPRPQIPDTNALLPEPLRESSASREENHGRYQLSNRKAHRSLGSDAQEAFTGSTDETLVQHTNTKALHPPKYFVRTYAPRLTVEPLGEHTDFAGCVQTEDQAPEVSSSTPTTGVPRPLNDHNTPVLQPSPADDPLPHHGFDAPQHGPVTHVTQERRPQASQVAHNQDYLQQDENAEVLHQNRESSQPHLRQPLLVREILQRSASRSKPLTPQTPRIDEDSTLLPDGLLLDVEDIPSLKELIPRKPQVPTARPLQSESSGPETTGHENTGPAAQLQHFARKRGPQHLHQHTNQSLNRSHVVDETYLQLPGDSGSPSGPFLESIPRTKKNFRRKEHSPLVSNPLSNPSHHDVPDARFRSNARALVRNPSLQVPEAQVVAGFQLNSRPRMLPKSSLRVQGPLAAPQSSQEESPLTNPVKPRGYAPGFQNRTKGVPILAQEDSLADSAPLAFNRRGPKGRNGSSYRPTQDARYQEGVNLCEAAGHLPESNLSDSQLSRQTQGNGLKSRTQHYSPQTFSLTTFDFKEPLTESEAIHLGRTVNRATSSQLGRSSLHLTTTTTQKDWIQKAKRSSLRPPPFVY